MTSNPHFSSYSSVNSTMAPYARWRRRDRPLEPGGRAFALVEGVHDQLQGMAPTGYQTMYDIVGNRGGDNPLDFVNDTRIPGILSGQVGFAYSVQNWKYSDFLESVPSWETWPSPNLAASQMLAQSNPSSPDVNFPVFFAELADFPKLIKGAGDALRNGLRRFLNPTTSGRFGAEQYLSWEFGWKPLVSDLSKLLDFTALVDKRVEELESLRRKPRRRNMKTWENRVHGNPHVFYPCSLYSAEVTCERTVHTLRKQWVSAQWTLTGSLPPTGSDDMRRLAHELVHGFGANSSQVIANVWEGLPWSWLIDWFGNTGDLLNANRNHVPASFSRICVMNYEETFATYRLLNNPYEATFSFPHSVVKWGRRIPTAAPTLEFFLPFIDGRKASILNSLAILRLRR